MSAVDAVPAGARSRAARGFASASPAALVALGGVLLLALLCRDVIHHPPTYDELLHVLAARGVEATGEPTIADGRYDRAYAYTLATARAIASAGDELTGARLLAWLGAAMLVALVGAWTTRRAGALAGGVAAAALAIHPWTIDLAVFARFYSWHAFALALAFCCAWTVVDARSKAVRAGAACVVLAAVALAFALQITTVIALGAIGLGMTAGLVFEHRATALPALRRRAPQYAIVGLAALLLGAFALHALDLLAPFRETPRWSAGDAGRITYYTTELMRATPLLWPLAPAAAFAACAWRPRLGIALVVAFAVVLAAHSLAAAKAARYAYYALPWLCMLSGLGAAAVAAQLRGRRARVLACVLVLAALPLSQEGWRTLRTAAGADTYERILGYGDESDWSSALPALRASLAAGDAVVTSNSMKALWYLGRYDYELNASLVPETDTGVELGRDPRTGRRVVSTPDSVAAVLRSRDRVLVVVETDKLDRPSGVPGATVVLLAGACAPLALPRAAGLTAWSCPATAASPTPPAPAARTG